MTLRSSVLALLRLANRAFPESASKNRLRAWFIGLHPGLPKELMVGPGECAVQVGLWDPVNLERLAKCVGPTGRVVLIEVSPDVAARHRERLESRSIHNVTIVNKGAWNQKGRHRLNLGNHPNSHQLEVDDVVMPNQEFQGSLCVEVDTLDNILDDAGVNTVDYLEVSVNGVELRVLDGISRRLARVPRLLVGGMMRDRASGEPLNRRVAAYLAERGFRTMITPPRGRTGTAWGQVDGAVFAWRRPG